MKNLQVENAFNNLMAFVEVYNKHSGKYIPDYVCVTVYLYEYYKLIVAMTYKTGESATQTVDHNDFSYHDLLNSVAQESKGRKRTVTILRDARNYIVHQTDTVTAAPGNIKQLYQDASVSDMQNLLLDMYAKTNKFCCVEYTAESFMEFFRLYVCQGCGFRDVDFEKYKSKTLNTMNLFRGNYV